MQNKFEKILRDTIDAYDVKAEKNATITLSQ
jgi:hypothetical protein